MKIRKLRFETVLLPQGWAHDICISINEIGIIQAIGGEGGEPVSGVTVPGMANVHSHAHQRLMQGLAERAGPSADSFWTWRETMYGFALKLSPEDLEAVAAQAYMEMLQSGFTSVGEFQYLHHQPDGTPYANRAEMSLRCVAAAEDVGIAITILPVLYTYGGFGGQLANSGQRRFINNVDGFLEIASALNGGIAPHSLRAVTKQNLQEVLAALPNVGPIHIHVAEQIKEVEDCQNWSGTRPVQYLLDNFELSNKWCAIHATHMTELETQNLAKSGVIAGLCPTTEANLGDGVFPAVTFGKAGGKFAIGSDSHISISPSEDLRMLEYSQRLTHHARNVLATGPNQSTGRSLYDAATLGGAQALQQNTGAIEIGRRADFVVLNTEHNSMLGRFGDNALDAWIFSGGNACVRDVYVAGKRVVKEGLHINAQTITSKFKSTLARLA